MSDGYPTPRFRAGAWSGQEEIPPPPVRGYPLPEPAPLPPARLSRLRQWVGERHPSIRDLGRAIHDIDEPETHALIAAIAGWPAGEVGVRAYEIPASQMDRLIQVYAATQDSQIRQRIAMVLQARMKRRFCALVWHVLQDRFADEALLSILFTGASGRRRFRAGESMRFLDFFRAADQTGTVPLPARVCRTLRASGQSVASFFRACEMPADGALALAVLSLYFADAESAVFDREHEALTILFASLSRPPSDRATADLLAAGFAAPLARYLELHEPPDCDHALLRQVAPRFGFPDPSAAMWSEVEEPLRLRFSQWTHLDRLQVSLAGQYNKERILSALYSHIENVIADPELPLVFVYFARFVLVDRVEEPDVMLLYPRAIFAQTYDLFTRQRATRLESLREAAAPGEAETPEETVAAMERVADSGEPERAADPESADAVPWPVNSVDRPVDSIPWPVDRERMVMARIAILETREERDRRKILSQQIIRGTCDRIVHLTFVDTPILYARQFLFDLLL